MSWRKANPVYAFLACCLVCLLVNCSGVGGGAYSSSYSSSSDSQWQLSLKLNLIASDLKMISDRVHNLEMNAITDRPGKNETPHELGVRATLLEGSMTACESRLDLLESGVDRMEKVVEPLRVAQMAAEVWAEVDAKIAARKKADSQSAGETTFKSWQAEGEQKAPATVTGTQP
jgi:hypothetical protein